MKRKINFARISRYVLWLGLIVCVSVTAAWAQASGTVIPSVCFEAKPETLTRTLTNSFCVGSTSTVACNSHTVGFSPAVPFGFYTAIFNPGQTQDTLYGYNGSAGLSLTVNSGLPLSQSFSFAHEPGETVLVISDGDAVYGYNNLSSTTLSIPRGISSHNYFAPGNLVYPAQPNSFLPGVHGDALRLKAVAGAPAATWVLNGGEAVPNVSAGQGCGTITYQGRLTDSGLPASGSYDLQIQAFDALTDGNAQGELFTLQNVQVTNGVFTVPLFFGSTFINNFIPRFLQIGVRPGIAPDTDPFTTLAPRQPLTQVPYAVNAQTAQTALNTTNAVNATNATNGFNVNGGTLNLNDNMLQLRTANDANHGMLFSSAIDGAEFRGLGGFIWKTGANGATERMRLDGTGSLTVGGNLTVNGTINGTVTNAVNATNADQLGGVLAANYLTNTSIFGQSVTTASGTAALSVTNATTAYSLVPGLTQTINVPANSSLLISTDGGIQSLGAIATFSVVDAAIFVDGVLAGERRIVISNFSVSASVDNWALSLGQTLTAGSHTIEVRVRYGLSGSANATASGNGGNTLLQGRLTVAVIRN